MFKLSKLFNSSSKKPLQALMKWTGLLFLISISIGSVVAFFLYSLDIVTQYRDHHLWMRYLLPFIGLFIGCLYYYNAAELAKGTNLILSSYNQKEKKIPFAMAPLIFLSTLLTHLGGGSAGREGTAVQMGAAMANQFSTFFNYNQEAKRLLLIMGISAGFSAVFGTPWAGAVFALEIMAFKNIQFSSIITSFLSAFIAHYTCLYWNIQHSQFTIQVMPPLNFIHFSWAIIAGILFGLTALVFYFINTFWEHVFKKIKKEYLRPLVGGVVLSLFFIFTDMNQFMGLGIPTIQQAFLAPVGSYDFILKLLLTSFTLGAGFKGGEITPLFFIGATLGNILILVIPLPMALMAGMGFVALFAGATHSVLTAILLGIEIFGLNAGIFIGIASIAAYFSSGTTGIYSAQTKAGLKWTFYQTIKPIFKR